MDNKQIKDFRFRLHLDVPPFDIVDDEYFSLIVSGPLSAHEKNFLFTHGLYDSYGGAFDELEWIGDSILEIITRNYLFRHYRDRFSPLYLNKVKIYIVQNYTLYCLLVEKNVCIATTSKKGVKRCADRLESTIGLLYYYFNNIMKNPSGLDILYDWFINTFNVKQMIEDFARGKNIPCAVAPEEIITLETPPEEEILELIMPPEYQENERVSDDEEVELPLIL